jgi:hypothetical protein
VLQPSAQDSTQEGVLLTIMVFINATTFHALGASNCCFPGQVRLIWECMRLLNGVERLA